MSKHTTRHYCRNTHCHAKLADPVDNEHHAFCTSGCHAIFYRHRCLVCEDAMRRKRDDQRFKNGHKACQNEYRRFPHVFDYPGVNPGHPTGVAPHKPLILAGQKWPLVASYLAKCSGAIKRGAAGIGKPKISRCVSGPIVRHHRTAGDDRLDLWALRHAVRSIRCVGELEIVVSETAGLG
jgi:hypothetical protein